MGAIFFSFLYLKERLRFKICTPIQFTFFDMKYRFQRENTQGDNEGRVCANFCAQKLDLDLESYVKTMEGI